MLQLRRKISLLTERQQEMKKKKMSCDRKVLTQDDRTWWKISDFREPGVFSKIIKKNMFLFTANELLFSANNSFPETKHLDNIYIVILFCFLIFHRLNFSKSFFFFFSVLHAHYLIVLFRWNFLLFTFCLSGFRILSRFFSSIHLLV